MFHCGCCTTEPVSHFFPAGSSSIHRFTTDVKNSCAFRVLRCHDLSSTSLSIIHTHYLCNSYYVAHRQGTVNSTVWAESSDNFSLKNNKGLTRYISACMFYFIPLPYFYSALVSLWHFACHMASFLRERKSDFCLECKLTNNNHHHKGVCCVWDQKYYPVVMATRIEKGCLVVRGRHQYPKTDSSSKLFPTE